MGLPGFEPGSQGILPLKDSSKGPKPCMLDQTTLQSHYILAE